MLGRFRAEHGISAPSRTFLSRGACRLSASWPKSAWLSMRILRGSYMAATCGNHVFSILRRTGAELRR